MGEYIELIGQLKPKNNGNFPIADVNDLKGGYIQLETIIQLNHTLSTKKVKQGMLAYVEETNLIYQYQRGAWVTWAGGGGGNSGGASITRVDFLEELEDDKLKISGQIVFVNEIKDLRYFNGTDWSSFSRIYVQPIPPEDKGGIWIDTSDEKVFTDSNRTIQNLLQVISVLQKKMNRLEWVLENQLDFGDFTNNHYNEYDDYETPEEPSYGDNIEGEVEELSEHLVRVVEETEPVEMKDRVPTGKHLSIKSGTYKEMVENANDFLPSELLWVEDRKQLWIKDSKTHKLIQIGSSGGGGDFPDPDLDPETMKQIITETIGSEEKIIGINFGDMANKNYDYQLRVVNGQVVLHDLKLDQEDLQGNDQALVIDKYYSKPYFPIVTTNDGSPMIYINSVYCGDKGTDKDYNPCSHNFVEIVNLAEEPLNLKGLFLHYTEKNTGSWVTLPLYGKIKPSGTFLVRGSQCSVMDTNTTLLKVKTFDMEWKQEDTLNAQGLYTVEGNIWGEDNKIQFAENCAFYLSGKETSRSYTEDPLQESAPWNAKAVIKWYIDLIGIGTYDSKALPNEAAPYPFKGSDILLHRYFNMDFVNQAIKATGARSNTAQWTHIDLSKLNERIDITDYTPKASFEHKDIFFNKNLLTEGAPNIITCSFGRNAHTTRCFNWMSKGYYDEFIWFTDTSGDYSENDIRESFKEGDGRTSLKNWNDPIYNRIRSITTDGTSFTVHKFIVDFDEPEDERVIYYRVGRPGAWSEERSFTLRNRQKVIDNGFNFLHHTDQQGFIEEEYETWRIAADYIDSDRVENPYHFSINTGDATQNGNRINEWIDYFDKGDPLFRHQEQMYTVGNNDLAPEFEGVLGRGNDFDKIDPVNVMYFFTFEHPTSIPKSLTGVYIPCIYSFTYGDTYFLSMNSEITSITRERIYKETELGVNVYKVQIKNWVEADMAEYGSESLIKWKVAFTHEAPFTIITPDLVKEYTGDPVEGVYTKKLGVTRGGSHLNTIGDYWFSTFLEDNEVNLVLCGHKHTYSNSRYIRDNVRGPVETWRTMEPTVYDPIYNEEEGIFPQWYIDLPDKEKQVVQLSNDSSLHFVKYVMCQGTGFKLASNKEVPAQNLPWQLEYYPITKQSWNTSGGKYDVTVNPGQKFPHYIIWNVGKGKETETDNSAAERPRIKGNAYKLNVKGDNSKPAIYNYNVPYEYTEIEKQGGNGSRAQDNNIIIEKFS